MNSEIIIFPTMTLHGLVAKFSAVTRKAYLQHPVDAKKKRNLSFVLRFLSDYCPLLRTLDLSHCETLTDDDMPLVPRSVHTLNLQGCCRITDKGMQHLPPEIQVS
jgi:hypothetical protein